MAPLTIGLLHPGEMGSGLGGRGNAVAPATAYEVGVADAFSATGLPDGLHRAAADVFRASEWPHVVRS